MANESAKNLVALFLETANTKGERPFLWAKRDGTYVSQSWRDAADEVIALAGGLNALGVEAGDRVGIVSENRPEWLLAELAILAAGAIAVPAYTTNTVNDHTHVLTNSGAKGVIVSTPGLAARLLPAALQSSATTFVIGMEPLESDQDSGLSLHNWGDIVANGKASSEDVRGRAAAMSGDDTAVIIYTSGTGGVPKGVMLQHKSILHNARGAADALTDVGLEDNVFLSFLPLSHSYEHLAGQFFPIYVGAEIYYAEGIDSLSRNMQESKPTIMTAVPRLYELMHGRITKDVQRTGGLKEKLFNTAVRLGRKKYEKTAPLTIGEKLMDGLVDKLVRNKVRGNFGGRLKVLVSGGAPLNPDMGIFFTALGLNLLQGYGQTESAPVISVNRPNDAKLHTVGPPLLATEVKIADDGEILVRGDLVMQGYWQDDAATAEVIKEGWLHTGDVGLIDDGGHLQITDRKKDIIVNSGGDTLSPQRVEGFLTVEPEISQAMVYGDKRPHLVALVVPDPEFAKEWCRAESRKAELAELVDDETFRRAVGDAIDRVNAGLSNIEKVRRFKLIAEPFTIENEMMTPSLKVRRHKVMELYGDDVIGLYG